MLLWGVLKIMCFKLITERVDRQSFTYLRRYAVPVNWCVRLKCTRAIVFDIGTTLQTGFAYIFKIVSGGSLLNKICEGWRLLVSEYACFKLDSGYNWKPVK